MHLMVENQCWDPVAMSQSANIDDFESHTLPNCSSLLEDATNAQFATAMSIAENSNNF